MTAQSKEGPAPSLGPFSLTEHYHDESQSLPVRFAT
jgi:hypothetical protein